MAASQHLCAKAGRGRLSCPALWTRGIIPIASLGQMPPCPGNPEVHPHGIMQGMVLQRKHDCSAIRGHWYSDGPGGEHSSTPELRRTAWGIVLIGDGGHGYVRLQGRVGLPHPRPESDHQQSRTLASHFPCQQHLRRGYPAFRTSDYLVGGSSKGNHRNPRGKNTDLWQNLDDALRARAGDVQSLKVKAHTLPKDAYHTEVDKMHFYRQRVR